MDKQTAIKILESEIRQKKLLITLSDNTILREGHQIVIDALQIALKVLGEK